MFVYIAIILIVIGTMTCCIKKCRTGNEQNDNIENLHVPNTRNSLVRYYIRHPNNINNVNNVNNVNNITPPEDTFIQTAIKNSKITYNKEINNNIKNIPKIKLKEYLESNKENCGITVDDDDNYLCCICYDVINEDDEIYLIPCKHVLHQKCLNDIAFEKAVCPFCREKLFV